MEKLPEGLLFFPALSCVVTRACNIHSFHLNVFVFGLSVSSLYQRKPSICEKNKPSQPSYHISRIGISGCVSGSVRKTTRVTFCFHFIIHSLALCHTHQKISPSQQTDLFFENSQKNIASTEPIQQKNKCRYIRTLL